MKWKTLVHNGVAFPPEYQPVGFKLRIRGREVPLSPLAEEMAVAWAKKKDTPYVQDPVFQANFLSSFAPQLPSEFHDVKLEEIDFGEIHRWVDEQKALAQDPEFRKKRAAERKRVREELRAKHGWAVVDGERYDVGNYMVEPPGIFMGRGNHPMRGKWKPRIFPKDVTLNLGEEAPHPPGDWKIVHDHNSTWIARWIDKLSDREKYVWLSDAAKLRQERDKAKYDKAESLGRHIDDVVKKICKGMKARDPKKRMVATAAYLIWRLAMRVGDEKDPDEADTVGASTLRVEHLRFAEGSVEFDFLGKDSVRWQKSLPGSEEDRTAAENLRRFTAGKKPEELVFSGITSRTVNRFFQSILPGLTAKVFRTYLATRVVLKYLANVPEEVRGASEAKKLLEARRANLQAAITCNHKRAIPKNWEQSVEAKKIRLAELRATPLRTEKQAARLQARIEKLQTALDLQLETRDYNLGTSLRNYIDPRVYQSWCRHFGVDWRKLYTSALQRKFQWSTRSVRRWEKYREAAKGGRSAGAGARPANAPASAAE